jgi:uncharacterized protein (TIGR02246 family)
MHFVRRSMIGAAIMLSSSFAAQAADEADAVQAAMNVWARSYGQSSSGAEMLPLYHEDAVFWGTGARVPFESRQAIEDYFNRQFASFSNRSVTFEPPVIRVVDETATATGLYTFAVTAQSGGNIVVTHRYSFTLLNEEGAWKIFHQHSSQMP